MKALKITAFLLFALLFVACGKQQQQQNVTRKDANEKIQGTQKVTDSKIERGKAVYDETGCATCHAIKGVGGKIGPALDGIGKKYDSKKMGEILLEPQKLNPNTVMPPFEGSEEDLEALVAYLMSLK
ncbi:MAG: cytochrome c [Armatimonadetes bacterium]|nr:cytochrome c [Armatimonadota bacterium]MDW8027733.1 c-type cytochrome [Armatimonadota bacterium]